MKNITAALACAACFSAHGQSAPNSVTIYGNLDAALTTLRPGSGTTLPGGSVATRASVTDRRMDSGIGPGSRLGFRGREDLGSGLAAVFTLETGYAVNNGVAQQGGLAWGRQVFVGLAGSNWTLTAGRQYSPMDVAFGSAEPMSGFYWGNPTVASGHGLYDSLGSTAGSGTFQSPGRVDNSVQGTATFGALTGKLMVAGGDQNGRGTGRLINPALAYVSGPLAVHASYVRIREPASMLTATAAPEWLTEAMVGGSYDVGFARLSTGVFQLVGPKNRANLSAVATLGATGASPFAYTWDKTRTVWLGAQVPVGAGQLNFAVSRVTYDYATGPDGRSTVLGSVYLYPLSKRTSLYATYGQVSNDAVSRTPLFATITAVTPNGFGSDPKALSIGMRHTF